MPEKNFVHVGVLILLMASRSDAELAFGYTPEWLAHESAVAFEGTPQTVTTYHLRGERWITEGRFIVEKRIKGPITIGDTITIRSIDWAGRTDQMGLADAVKLKRRALILATVARDTFPETDGHYVFLRHSWNRPFIYTDESVKHLYSEQGDSITEYDDVLRRIEAQVAKEADLARRHWRGHVVKKLTEVDFDSDAQRELNGGSAVLLHTPDYKEP